MKRALLIFLAFACFFTGCTQPAAEPVVLKPLPAVSEPYGLDAAVLYDGQSDSLYWQDVCDLLEQPVALGLTVTPVDISGSYDLADFDLLIPDSALAESDDMPQLASELEIFTQNGGYVLLDNAFAQVLPLDYLGLTATSNVEACPTSMTYPELGADLGAIQEVIRDFAGLYPEFYEAEDLLSRNYGCCFTTDTAISLASVGDQAIYTYNHYGQGGVLLTNPLLPNFYSLGNFAMTHRSDETAFSGTTAACNQLLYSRFAAYVAKQKYGYALNRVFGYNGSPSMSWELHYEEMTAFEHNSMLLFDEICREYRQIPSYTIIRSAYWWFLRAETVTYLLNDHGKYHMDLEESAYSSGTHIVSDDQWLHLSKLEDAGSYFRDYPEYNYRAYPAFGDVDGDGEAELVSGSQDGFFYVYDDLAFDDRLQVSKARRLTDDSGLALQVSGFSAPALADLDGDGHTDLLSGCADGNLYWYRSLGNGTFESKGIYLQTDIPGQSLPAFGDANGDGITDLAVGSDQSILLLYYGAAGEGYSQKHMTSLSKTCVNAELGHWLSPAFRDDTLAVGTFLGYVALLEDGEFVGYLDTEEMNFKGNNHVQFGNYCAPTFYDLNGDGDEDLVCGALEYGLAYPIDSEYFPQRDQLQAQFNYAAANHQYIGVHHYSNGFASPEREAYELNRHKEAFAAYGHGFEGLGANMHTWYTSVLDDTQTLDSEYAAGLRWNSGFSSPGDPGVAPQYAAENVISLPFFLQTDGEDTMLVQNCSVLPYADTAWSDISAKYQMPICVYYHCDFVYENDAGARDYVQKVSNFQYANGYNFVREDQLMQASTAAYDLEVEAHLQDSVLYLSPKEASHGGVELQFAEDIDADRYQTDAKVSRRQGNSLFFRLGEPVTVSETAQESPLRQVNLPAEITMQEDGAVIRFLDDGMLQVITPLGYTADTQSTGWTVTRQQNQLVFTKYGEADTLVLKKQ